MIKIFAKALAPIVVFSRGTGDGTSWENATEIELLSGGTSAVGTSLKLYIYNSFNGSTDELQGDLSYTMIYPVGAFNMYVEMGFCFRPTAVGTDFAIN